MPAPNFMLQDLVGALTAIALLPAFLVFPGYLLAWLLDIFEFRRRTAAFRFAFALPLSIAVCPILTYLLGRYASMPIARGAYLAGALAALFLIARRFSFPDRGFNRKIAAILAVWLVVCLFSLVDLQIGERLYYPTSALDYSVRTAFVHSISVTGVPPQNPFFQPGHPVALRYHYFWLMMCSLAEQISGGRVTSRQALIGGTFWAGVALMALLAVYLRIFSAASEFRRRAFTGILLLAITGLDIVPSLFFLFLYARGMLGFVLPSVEWWNEHVDWFVYSTLWAPHALSAMIACFIAFLLLWHAAAARRYILPAACALASAVGASIYVAFVFAIFLSVWTVITACRKWYRETAVLCVTGAIAIALALPYLHDLAGPGAGGPLFTFTVRDFSLAALIRTPAISELWRRLLVNGTLLPVNYLLEFGFFFLVARYQWQRHRLSGRPLSRANLAGAVMVATSVLACTFLRSSVIGCNDLGWRGLLVAEFVLLLWAADLFANRERLDFLSASQRQLLVVFFALGFAGTVYDLAIVRLYPVLADRGVVPPLDWMSPDRDFGRRTYAERAAYEWLHTATPANAAVQSNPKVVFQDTVGMIYGDRHSVAADLNCLTIFGGDAVQCAPVVSRVQAMFPANAAAPSTLQEGCLALPVDTFVAKDTDPVWSNRQSWVWTERPAYANAYMRLFRCQSRSRTLTSSR